MAHVTNLHLDIEPASGGGIWRRRMLHGSGSPAASAMGVGGRKEWLRKHLVVVSEGSGSSALLRSASEPKNLRESSSSLAHLPQISNLPRSSTRMTLKSGSRLTLASHSSVQLDELPQPGEGSDAESERSTRAGSKDTAGATGNTPFGQNTGELEKFAAEKRKSQVGPKKGARAQWASALESALEEADVQLLFRLDLPLMVKAVADGEVTSLKEVGPPKWDMLKANSSKLLKDLKKSKSFRPGQMESLQVVLDLYSSLEEEGCMQGFDALCRSFAFLFGSLEQVEKVLDVNRNGTLSTTEFSMAMSLAGLDLSAICGLDEREIFLAVDSNHTGSISIEELIRLCSSKPEPESSKKGKMDRAQKQREAKAAAQKAKKKIPMSTSAIIEQAGLKVVQEKEVEGVRFQAMVVPKETTGFAQTVSASSAGMDASIDVHDEEEIDEVLEVLAKEEIHRAQAKWISISRWLASVLGAASLADPGERAKTWEDERQQAYQAVSEVPMVPMAAALPFVHKAQADPSPDPGGSKESGDSELLTLMQAGVHLDDELERLFLEEANELEGEKKLLDKAGTRKFFEDLMLADFKWHKELRMVILDRLYDDTLTVQKEEEGFSKGLTIRSLKVVLHRMLRDRTEGWIDSFRLNIERQLKKGNKAATRVARALGI